MDGACLVYFCCGHTPVEDMNVGIFGVHVMECMCAQTRSRFILSSERVLGNGIKSKPMFVPWEKSPLPAAQRRLEPVMLHHTGQ